MKDLPQLYTSYWSNRDLSRLNVVPVGISRGTPRFPVPYRYRQARLLAPSRETFAIRSDEEFERAYVAGLEEIGAQKIADLLLRISREEGGKPLALLCFERDRKDCHRGQFARWFRIKTGQEVPEMDVRDRGVFEENYQERLF